MRDEGKPKRGRNTERGNRSKGSRATMFLTEEQLNFHKRIRTTKKHADMAQLVEQRIRNAQVVGSEKTSFVDTNEVFSIKST